MKIIIKQVKRVKVSEFRALYKDADWWEDEYDKDTRFVNKLVKGSFCFIAAFNEKNEMIGMGRALSDACSDAYIQDLTVLKTYRGKGIGSLITNKIIEILKNNGVDWIGLISEPDSIGFHKKNGFVEMRSYLPMKLKH